MPVDHRFRGMKTLGIDGPGAATLCDRLLARLDGRVATIEARAETTAKTGATTAFEIGRDGAWSGAGEGRDLDSLLDSLAPSHEYAVLVGFPDVRVPTVTLDGADARETIESVPDAESADLDAVLEAIADVEPRVTLESLVARVKSSPRADRAGAIATFTGRVRELDGEDDAPTSHLEFEKYEGIADERMATIRRELEDREGVQEVLMHHRTGVVAAGEDIVFVVVLAGHREEAFRTVEDGINRLKAEVPLFKKETTAESEFWVHDRS